MEMTGTAKQHRRRMLVYTTSWLVSTKSSKMAIIRRRGHGRRGETLNPLPCLNAQLDTLHSFVKSHTGRTVTNSRPIVLTV